MVFPPILLDYIGSNSTTQDTLRQIILATQRVKRYRKFEALILGQLAEMPFASRDVIASLRKSAQPIRFCSALDARACEITLEHAGLSHPDHWRTPDVIRALSIASGN